MVHNLRAEGLIKQAPQDRQAVETIKPTVDAQVDPDVERANTLYDEIFDKYPVAGKQSKSSEDESQIRRDIEKIDDAVKLFGTDSQDKKVQLKQIKEKLEAQLPHSVREWSNDFWKKCLRRVQTWTGIKPNHTTALAFIVVATVGLIASMFALLANVLKTKDLLPKVEVPSHNKVTQTPNSLVNQQPIESPAFSNSNRPNSTLDGKPGTEKIRVSAGQSKNAISDKVVITVIGINFEETSSGSLGHTITGEIGQIGKKSTKFVRREIGYSTRLKINSETYEIRITAVETFFATFLVTKIE